jgi:hypothetical protein
MPVASVDVSTVAVGVGVSLTTGSGVLVHALSNRRDADSTAAAGRSLIAATA